MSDKQLDKAQEIAAEKLHQALHLEYGTDCVPDGPNIHCEDQVVSRAVIDGVLRGWRDEVRVSEAALRADLERAEQAHMRVLRDFSQSAEADKRYALEAERDVLQQRINKALETLANGEHVTGGNFWTRSVRAALADADNQPIEETP